MCSRSSCRCSTRARLTDDIGTVQFNNTAIFITTNLCQHIALEGKVDPRSDAGKALIKRELCAAGLPIELLNRIDGFLLFNVLDNPTVEKVVKASVEKLNKKPALIDKGIRITLSDADIAHIVADKYIEVEGAREVKRFVNRELAKPLVPIAHDAKQPGIAQAVYNPDKNGFDMTFIPADPHAPANDLATKPVTHPVSSFAAAAPG